MIEADGYMHGETNVGLTWDAVQKVRPFGYTASCGAGEFFVSSDGTPVNAPTVPGHKYEMTVSGTFYAGGNDDYDIRADAEYSQDRSQFASDPTLWTVAVNGYGGYGEQLLDLEVDGNVINWGTYNPSHVYTKQFIAGASATSFALNIYDIYTPNNTGGLCVSLADRGNIGTFDGFFSPVDNGMLNVAKAGQAIPLKWRLLDYNGVPVADLASVGVKVASLSCASGETPDVIEEYAAGASGLQYLGDGYWQFNWKTPKSYANSCKTMTLTLLGDGSTHSADFQFK